MGIGEKNTSPRESLDVGCNVLRVPIQTDDPVIQIIYCNQKHVGRPLIRSRNQDLGKPAQQDKKKES
jgi:hypothetical protein